MSPRHRSSLPIASDRPSGTAAAGVFFATLAVAAPLLLAMPAVPDAVFYNQALAFAGWGLWIAWLASLRPASGAAGAERQASTAGLRLAVLAIGLCATFAASRIGLGQASAAAVLLAAIGVLLVASRADESVALQMATAWWLVGLSSAVIASVQFFAPSLADGWPIAATTVPGRAVGNLRQPNHLATALLCAMVMTAALWQAGRLRPALATSSLVVMVLGVALSASRTGALALAVLLLWALWDRSLPRAARWMLALTPALYLLCWFGLVEYAQAQGLHFHAAERLGTQGDVSSSRFAIWRNALVLVAQHPWTGVGWGNFNFAWTFTPFADRPVAFFDHAHNLPLHLAVEIGVPATTLVLGLLGVALWRARAAWLLSAAHDRTARAAVVLLAVLALHSLLEYPLWYAYFLLPAAWALGTALRAEPGAFGAPPGRAARLWRTWGVGMALAATYAVWDHRRIEAIYAPTAGAAPLLSRIADGRRSLLFGHHADYAAVTTPPGTADVASFRRPLHQLIDVRLMRAYIDALRSAGDDNAALYAAQRLREFRRSDAQAYFADCRPDNTAPPFQCDTTPVPLTWRDLDP